MVRIKRSLRVSFTNEKGWSFNTIDPSNPNSLGKGGHMGHLEAHLRPDEVAIHLFDVFNSLKDVCELVDNYETVLANCELARNTVLNAKGAEEWAKSLEKSFLAGKM